MVGGLASRILTVTSGPRHARRRLPAGQNRPRTHPAHEPRLGFAPQLLVAGPGVTPGVSQPSSSVSTGHTPLQNHQQRNAALDAGIRGTEGYCVRWREMGAEALGRFQGLVPASVWGFESPF